MNETECRRPDCDETFDSSLTYQIHLATDHDLPWLEIDNYPRAPSNR